jgi:hypothetical protein
MESSGNVCCRMLVRIAMRDNHVNCFIVEPWYHLQHHPNAGPTNLFVWDNDVCLFLAGFRVATLETYSCDSLRQLVF